MSVKRKVVDKRLTLFRTCGICGKSFVTTADTQWVGQVRRETAGHHLLLLHDLLSGQLQVQGLV